MKKLTAALAFACAVTFTAGAGAVDFGANDDTGKYLGASSSAYFGQMAAAGLKQNVMTLKWDPSAPMAIPDRDFLDAAIPLAQAKGIKVVFALYGARPTTFTGDGGTAEAFAAWAAQVARTYPSVKNMIIGNEPNQPRFWRPQFDASGNQASAAGFGPVLAAAYDALKAVDGSIQVIGIGLSPRGNDRPDAPSNISSSPVRFLKAFGDWYRGSGRTRPVMDSFSFHPYPNANSDPLSRGYVWPNAGVPNLDRIKQALHDAFDGTAHPTTASGLKFFLDEVGWQVDTSGNAAYAGSENVNVTTEANQSQIYGELVRTTACDPTVAAVNIFGFYDESDRGAGFQAGLYRKDGTARPSADSVSRAIAAGCSGNRSSWSAARRVVGADAEFGNLSKSRSPKQRAWAFNATALEDAGYRAGIFKSGTASSQITRELAAVSSPVTKVEGLVKAGHSPRIQFPSVALPAGKYVYAIKLSAWANDSRTTTLVSKAFQVGAATAATKKPTKAKAKVKSKKKGK
ncbi:MAG: hypothetical protein M3R12_08435 [Actinomycetota bacterium]|nr:hypothetical protein [Actinomycetota bacterium]